MAEKEAHLDKEYKEKAQDMKLDVQDIRKKFDGRCEEFKRQLAAYKNNNEAIRKLNLTIYKYHRDLENQRQAARKKAINDLIELGNSVGREVDEKNKEHQKRNERNRSTNPEDCRIGDDLWGNPRIEC